VISSADGEVSSLTEKAKQSGVSITEKIPGAAQLAGAQ
jgi:hypothetical protein